MTDPTETRVARHCRSAEEFRTSPDPRCAEFGIDPRDRVDELEFGVAAIPSKSVNDLELKSRVLKRRLAELGEANPVQRRITSFLETIVNKERVDFRLD